MAPGDGRLRFLIGGTAVAGFPAWNAGRRSGDVAGTKPEVEPLPTRSRFRIPVPTLVPTPDLRHDAVSSGYGVGMPSAEHESPVALNKLDPDTATWLLVDISI